MGRPRRPEGRSGSVDPPEPPHSWVVDGGSDCEHGAVDTVALGLGGAFEYERCRRCDGIVVSRLVD